MEITLKEQQKLSQDESDEKKEDDKHVEGDLEPLRSLSNEQTSSNDINKKNDRKIAFLTIKIKNIAEIDTVRQIFDVYGHVYISVLADGDDKTRDKFELCIENATEEIKMTIHSKDYKEVKYVNPQFQGTWLRFKRSFHATCWEKFELENFPFDVQDLTVAFAEMSALYKLLPEPKLAKKEKEQPNHHHSTGNRSSMILDSPQSIKSKKNKESFQKKIHDANEIEIEDEMIIITNETSNPNHHHHNILSPKTMENEEDIYFADVQSKYFLSPEFNLEKPSIKFSLSCEGSKSMTKYSLCLLYLKVSRKWYSYHQIIIPLIIISGLSLVAFAISSNNLSDRYCYLITLLLVFISFHNVVRDILPKISSLTMMDKFIYIMLFVITCMMIESIFLTNDNLLNDDLDHILCYIFICLWLIINIVFATYSYYIYQIERTKLNVKGTRFERKNHSNKEPSSIFIVANGKEVVEAYKLSCTIDTGHYFPITE